MSEAAAVDGLGWAVVVFCGVVLDDCGFVEWLPDVLLGLEPLVRLAVGDVLAEGRLIEIGVDSAVFSIPRRAGSTVDRFVLRLLGDAG